jgi:hypothetical protein
MASAYLYLTQGGVTELLTSWTQPPGEPTAVSKGLGKRFDSTHFNPTLTSGTNPLVVTFVANDNYGRQYTASYSLPVRNRAQFGQFDPGWRKPRGALTAKTRLDQLGQSSVGKYLSDSAVGGNYTSPAWISGRVLGTNFLYVSCHGTPDIYETNDSQPVHDGPKTQSNSHESVLNPGVFDPIKYLLGQDFYPPYNVSGSPPLNFMFIDTCETLALSFDGVLYPKANMWVVPLALTNQAVGGFTVKTKDVHADTIANKLMDEISFGWPAGKVIENGVLQMNLAGVEGKDPVTGNWVLILPSHIALEGDPYTKVAGVYTGNSLPILNWK